MATNVRSVCPSSANRLQCIASSLALNGQPLHLPSLLARRGDRGIRGKPRVMSARGGTGREESTSAGPKVEESEVSAFEMEDWARGAGWEGAKSTATFTPGKQLLSKG